MTWRLVGVNHPNAKLTPSQAAEIRGLYAAGCSQRELGAAYGLHFSTIGRVVRRETWRHP